MWPGLGWLRSTAAAGGGVGWNGRGVYGGCQLPAGAGEGGEGTLAKIGRRERERRREPFAKTARMARSGSSSSREAVGGLLG